MVEPHPATTWASEVLSFWFETLSPADWFKPSAALDVDIAGRFAGLHANLAARNPIDLAMTADQALAAVIVLDQFPRNMFRGTARAFATDGLALHTARLALAQGHDHQVETARRVFLYLPFEHSEALDDQDTSVALITPLGDAEWTRYAILHRDIIARFGRFPHRNAVQRRTSTPDEMAFLAAGDNAFGQSTAD